MIKFFRKIRQKLLTENKFNKYLLYAIGEIVLVVIGILIALQINNYNEARKNREKEKLILQQILKSLNNDFVGFEKFWNSRMERKKEGLDSLQIYIFDKKNTSSDHILNAYNAAKQDVLFRFDNGPFEALKSLGLDIIKNDSLRTIINSTYTVSLPIAVKLAEEVNKDNLPRINKMEDYFLVASPVIHENGNKHIHSKFKVSNILENPYFLEVYSLEKRKYDNYIYNMENMKKAMTKLKVLIEEELKN